MAFDFSNSMFYQQPPSGIVHPSQRNDGQLNLFGAIWVLSSSCSLMFSLIHFTHCNRRVHKHLNETPQISLLILKAISTVGFKGNCKKKCFGPSWRTEAAVILDLWRLRCVFTAENSLCEKYVATKSYFLSYPSAMILSSSKADTNCTHLSAISRSLTNLVHLFFRIFTVSIWTLELKHPHSRKSKCFPVSEYHKLLLLVYFHPFAWQNKICCQDKVKVVFSLCHFSI